MNHKHSGFSPESLRLIGAALALQHVTSTAASITPIPSTGRFVVIGTPAEVARLLEVAPATTTAAPLSAEQLDSIARNYFAESYAQEHVKNAIYDAFLEAGVIAQARAAATYQPQTAMYQADGAMYQAAPQATAPQSVGEQALPPLPKQPDELRARWKCEDCDGRGHDGEAHWQGEFQPPEPYPCSTCNGAGWVECEALLPEQTTEYGQACARAALDMRASSAPAGLMAEILALAETGMCHGLLADDYCSQIVAKIKAATPSSASSAPAGRNAVLGEAVRRVVNVKTETDGELAVLDEVIVRLHEMKTIASTTTPSSASSAPADPVMILLRDAARAWNNEAESELDAAMERIECFLLDSRTATPSSAAPAAQAGEAVDENHYSLVTAALGELKQDYSSECLAMASTEEYVEDAVSQLIQAGYRKIAPAAAAAPAEDAKDAAPAVSADQERDPLYEKAAMVVRANNRASVSLVQRHLVIGYNRASRLIEAMEAEGLVSKPDGNGHRTVLSSSQHSAKAGKCNVPPLGWYCTRAPGHVGPCAAHPADEHDHSEGGHHD